MENNKFLSLDGVIGRRGFILNYLLVTIIVGIISIALNTLFLVFFPALYSSCNAGISIISIFLLYPSIERRVKDMFGNPERDMNFYLLMCAFVIGMCIPLIKFFVTIALMAAEGKITGNLPKSEVIKFNWGAFLGTWIWGLFNRSYKTLWMIPLTITPAAFPFSLICGMKGNEWAYKNKPVENLEKFHDNQRMQAVVWSILAPILSIVISVSILLGGVSFVKNIEKQHPGIVKIQMEKGFKSIIKAVGVSIYTKYEKAPEGYKFYVNPKNWKRSSSKDKNGYYMITVYNAMIEEGISLTSKEPLNDLINKTKIYSSFNNEILCECNIPDGENADFSNLMDILDKYLKVNEFPSTP